MSQKRARTSAEHPQGCSCTFLGHYGGPLQLLPLFSLFWLIGDLIGDPYYPIFFRIFLDQAPGKINFQKAVTWVRIMEKFDIFYIENVKFHGESEKHMIRWVILGL